MKVIFVVFTLFLTQLTFADVMDVNQVMDRYDNELLQAEELIKIGDQVNGCHRVLELENGAKAWEVDISRHEMARYEQTLQYAQEILQKRCDVDLL